LAYLGIIGHADDIKALRSIFLAERLKPGHLYLAGIAVGAPKVENEGMALEVGEGDLFAGEIDEREIGRRLAAHRLIHVGRDDGRVVLDEVDSVGAGGFSGADAVTMVPYAGEDDQHQAGGESEKQERFAEHRRILRARSFALTLVYRVGRNRCTLFVLRCA